MPLFKTDLIYRINVEQRKISNVLSVQNLTSSNASTSSVVASRGDWWVETISNDNQALIIYSSLVVLTIVVAISSSFGFFQYCITASGRLHNTMFGKIVFSPMRFFSINPSGRILNRFSKDVGAMDETLPTTMIDTIQVGTKLFPICIGGLYAFLVSMGYWDSKGPRFLNQTTLCLHLTTFSGL